MPDLAPITRAARREARVRAQHDQARQARDELIVAAVEQGASQHSVGRAAGLTQAGVSHILRRASEAADPAR